VSGLEPFRARLDEIDEKVIALLGERFTVCREIAEYKREHNIPTMQQGRGRGGARAVRDRRALAGIPGGFAESFFELLIDATCRMEDEMISSVQARSRDDGQ
jgi:4-amino-4-deoxychorismate mutase